MRVSHPPKATLTWLTCQLHGVGYTAGEIAELLDDGGSRGRRVQRVRDRLRRPRPGAGS